MEKGSLSKIKKFYPFIITYTRQHLVIVSIDWIKNLMVGSITATVLNTVGAAFLGGTFFGHNMPLVFGSLGAIMLTSGVLIEVIKIRSSIRKITEKGIQLDDEIFKEKS